MATLLTANGEAREVTPRNGRTFELDELQGYVGGYIEGLRVTRDGGWMFLNEDGKGLDLPYNDAATLLMRNIIGDDDYIVGDVVVCTQLEAGDGPDEEEL